ncbi:hypothetical protein BU25DRAFT_411632 [Macroventuria anomochaeta]|uniref:Uncharacterized protein n=1 Tax=Macroventuria anomochaeta TaxID=301207 RepID=A0ACB6RY71_9PLEO|nr:uncharacterized protein BU25DRAFT_411632 [Macroventuria anomochaeta]KAF2626657.1 hypothetical protein BU25DRAFT_411632 [Macroventuria anomochaeta]
MANRILSPATNFVAAFRHTRIAYRQTNGADTTELAQLTAESNNDRSTKDSSYPSAPPSKRTVPGGFGKPTWTHHYKSQFTGWRFGALHFAAWAAIVFLINMTVTIWGSTIYKKTAGSLSEGDCGHIKTLNRGIHILINILSTILLSGSNYCMQCLSAPTRADIDKAHAARTWLDVGVPSIRNLKHISRRRLWMWVLLGSSSVPLHLFYNSAVYASVSTNSYKVYLVSEAFLDDPECRNCTDKSDWQSYYTSSPPSGYFDPLITLWSQSKNGSLNRLEPAECLAEYATALQSDRRNVLLVMDNAQASTSPYNRSLTLLNNTNVYWASGFSASYGTDPDDAPESYSWICSGVGYDPKSPCANRVQDIKNAPQTWEVGNICPAYRMNLCGQSRWPVKYCLSEPAIPRCRLHFSPVIATIVTVLNLFKAVLMWFVIYSTKDDPLLTMGDAVASFLDENDPATTNLSLLSLQDCSTDYDAGAKPWHDQRWRWKDTTSKKRRATTIGLFATALIIIMILLIWGSKAIGNYASISSTAIFSLGFGAVDTRALIKGGDGFPTDMIGLVLIANLPQVILSFLYFAYNGMFTAMLLGYEWTSYAHKRKGLRVSRTPSGLQRSTYFLQLPYRFGVPLVVLSGTLHWLVSQSIFVVAMDEYNRYGLYQSATNMCGYSPIAMLVVIILGVFMVAAVVSFGYIPYKTGMPLAGSCSLAISAACHPAQYPEAKDGALSEQKVQWGVVSTGVDGIGHCAFSSNEVEPLVDGRMYA